MTHVKLQQALSYGWIVLVMMLVVVLGWTAQQAVADSPQLGEAEHLVTIYDRGEEQTIITKAQTIEAALEQADIDLQPSDQVEPARDAKLVAKSYNVNVYRARPVLVVDGSTQVKVHTAEQSDEAIAAKAGIKLYDEDTTHLSRVDNVLYAGGAGLRLEIDRATSFKLNLYGKTFTARTQATTIGAMLTEKGIVLGPKDGVTPQADTPIREGMQVKVWRDGKQTITLEEAIKMPVEEIQDMDHEIGYREVRTAGKPGVKQVTYEIVMRGGKEVSRKKITSVVTKKPVKQVVIVGAKNKFGGSVNEWLAALRACEAGGNYQTDTGNGFYGAYQFMQSTWDRIASMTGRDHLIGVRPSEASPAAQDAMIIDNTNLSSGGLATQNPGCYSKTGISAFPPQ